jgi:aerobic carbon-monoxide dehydrogenase medium subunit
MSEPLDRLPPFEYVKPASISEAIEFLRGHPGEARPFLGGTDCFVRLRDRAWQALYLVDLKHLPGMQDLRFDPAAGLRMGAAVSMNRLIALPEAQKNYPVLVAAARTVGSYQLRTRATVVGNICNASPGGDTLGPCLVYGGIIHIAGVNGERTEELAAFFKGPGKTSLQPGEIVTSLQLPLPPAGAQGIYESLGRNALGDLAIVAVTILGWPEKKNKSGFAFRIVLSAVAPTPLAANQAQERMSEKTIDDKTIGEAARLCEQACKPIDDLRGGARYRKEMVRRLAERALKKVCQDLQTG